jgi:hypothetical protein
MRVRLPSAEAFAAIRISSAAHGLVRTGAGQRQVFVAMTAIVIGLTNSPRGIVELAQFADPIA